MTTGMTAGMAVLAVGQAQPTQDPSSQTPSSGDSTGRSAPAPALTGIVGMGDEDNEETDNGGLPQIPALLGGRGTSAAFLSELKKSNYLRGGLNVSTTYDDNPLLAPSGAVGEGSISIFPNVSLEESTSRTRWTLGYAGGLTVNQRYTDQNQNSQSVNFDSQFRLSPHVNLRVAENFSLITGLFDASDGTGTIVGSGGPNGSLITPLATQRSSTTTVEMNYHFALNDLVGASGSFYALHYSNQANGSQITQPTQLTDTQTGSGSAFWLHRMFRDDWGGLNYRFDRITFNAGSGETRVHSFNFVDTLNLAKRFSFTGYIGPQYSENQGLLPRATEPSASSGWSVSGGVEGAWRAARTSLSAGYSRSISDGSGVLGAVTLQNVHANFRRELVPGWSAVLTVNHGTNQAVTVPFVTSANSINLTSVGASVERNVGKSIGLRFGYTHDFQQEFGVAGSTQTLDASRNRFVVTLSYQWAKPLGL